MKIALFMIKKMIEIALSNVALYKNKKLKSNEIVLFSVALKITCLFSCKKTKKKHPRVAKNGKTRVTYH